MVFVKMSQLLQETKLSSAGDKSVFKSLAVDRHSKTPYSDATQVSGLLCVEDFFATIRFYPFRSPSVGRRLHGFQGLSFTDRTMLFLQ